MPDRRLHATPAARWQLAISASDSTDGSLKGGGIGISGATEVSDELLVEELEGSWLGTLSLFDGQSSFAGAATGHAPPPRWWSAVDAAASFLVPSPSALLALGVARSLCARVLHVEEAAGTTRRLRRTTTDRSSPSCDPGGIRNAPRTSCACSSTWQVFPTCNGTDCTTRTVRAIVDPASEQDAVEAPW